MKRFTEFLALGNMNKDSIASIATSLSIPGALPSQNFYSTARRRGDRERSPKKRGRFKTSGDRLLRFYVSRSSYLRGARRT
jgi:hypothetical protein